MSDEHLPVTVNPMTILDRLTAREIDPAKLGDVINLIKTWNLDRAKEAFYADLALCQAEFPSVIEDGKNTQTGSTYAFLETVQRVAKPIYCKYGFSLSWSEGDIQEGGLRRVIMLVRHRGGYSETHLGHYDIDGEGPKGGRTMNKIQGTVSMHTYAQRDMMRQFFNLVIGGMDKDGQSISSGLDDEQAVALNELLADIRGESSEEKWEAWGAKFWRWVESFCPGASTERMNAVKSSHFQKIKDYLEGLKKKGAAK